MKQLIFVLFLLLPLFSVGQDKKNAINILSGIGFSHQITGEEYHRLKNRNTQEFIPKVDRTLLLSINYRFGINYQRKIIKGFHAKIGIILANWSEKHTHNHTLIHQKNFYYIETPLSLQYKLGNKALQPYIEIGASPMFDLQNNPPLYQTSLPPFAIHFALHSSVGLSYQISTRFSFFTQISGRFKITPTEYDITPYQVGLELGGSFCF